MSKFGRLKTLYLEDVIDTVKRGGIDEKIDRC